MSNGAANSFFFSVVRGHLSYMIGIISMMVGRQCKGSRSFGHFHRGESALLRTCLVGL